MHLRNLDLILGIHCEHPETFHPTLGVLSITAEVTDLMIQRIERLVDLQIVDHQAFSIEYQCPEMVWFSSEDDLERFEIVDRLSGRAVTRLLDRNLPVLLCPPLKSYVTAMHEIFVGDPIMVVYHDSIYWECQTDKARCVSDNVSLSTLKHIRETLYCFKGSQI